MIKSNDLQILTKLKETPIERIKPKTQEDILLSKDIHKKNRWKGFNNRNVQAVWDRLENMGNFNAYNVINLGPYNNINGFWKSEPCFIVGCGPSLRGFDLNQLNGLHTIGINHLIEDYDGFEWFFFLDDRFLKKTSYDITKFKGKIFCSHKCRLLPYTNNVRYKALGTTFNIPERIEEGLWNGRMSGIAALNLALISGANPIYLLGIDCGGGDYTDYHYKKNYTGAVYNEKKRMKYVNNAGFFDRFSKYKDRVINLSSISNIKTFKKMKFEDIPKEHKNKTVKVIKRDPIICHVGTMKSIKEMNDISQHVFNRSLGNHIYAGINSSLPKADIYLLECYINQADKYREFKRPHKNSKVISLIHSCSKCMPSIDSDEVVTITYSWKGVMQQKNIDSRMIYAGINAEIYDLPKDYTKKTFGRITRYSRGKVHPKWFEVKNNILDEIKDSECHIISRNYPKMNRDRLFVYDDVLIHEEEKKAKYLQKVNIFADMHFTFIETFSLCLLQAMASGCAIVLLRGQPAMEEIIGQNGFVCTGIPEFENTVKQLLKDSEKTKEYGHKAKIRAKEFTVDRMINKWNALFEDLLK